ncbi:MAG: DUF2490 domain-containing protein [Bacteroidetes bacterium]|nr:DUF2490 domain-containing protein [Bacteroidota bacterium]
MLTKITKLLLISALLFCGSIRPAQAQTQFAGWVGTFQNYKLSSRFGAYFDIQYRTTDQVRQLHQLMLRPGLNIYITPQLTGTVGYAYIPQQRVNTGVEGYLPEHRIWEQLVFTHKLPHRSTLAHRLRLEQRYIPKHHPQNGDLVHDGFRKAHRLRYFFRGIVPLGGQAGTAFTKGWFTSVQNEIFFNLGDASGLNGKAFDQNRAYVSVGYRTSKAFDVEVGYMNQYISGVGSASTNNHIAQLATYVRL